MKKYIRELYKKIFTKHYAINFCYPETEIVEKCRVIIFKMLDDRKLYKKHKGFLYLLIDYIERKGVTTTVQLEALERITNGC